MNMMGEAKRASSTIITTSPSSTRLNPTFRKPAVVMVETNRVVDLVA